MKDNNKDFLLWRISTTMSKKEGYYSEQIFYVLIWGSLSFLDGFSIVTLLIGAIITMLYSIIVGKKFGEKKEVCGSYVFFVRGVSALCVTFTFLSVGVKTQFLLRNTKFHIFIILGVLVSLALLLVAYTIFMRSSVSRTLATKEIEFFEWRKDALEEILNTFSVPRAAAGVLFAMAIWEMRGRSEVMNIISILTFVFAGLTWSGVINLYKYYYLKNHKELLESSSDLEEG